MKRTPIFSAAALCLVGCVTAPVGPIQSAPPPSAISAPSPEMLEAIVLQGHRALTLSALAYDSAAKVATTAVKAGLVPREMLPTLKELNREATAALAFGYSAGSAAEKARAAMTLDGIVRRIRSLAPG